VAVQCLPGELGGDARPSSSPTAPPHRLQIHRASTFERGRLLRARSSPPSTGIAFTFFFSVVKASSGEPFSFFFMLSFQFARLVTKFVRGKSGSYILLTILSVSHHPNSYRRTCMIYAIWTMTFSIINSSSNNNNNNNNNKDNNNNNNNNNNNIMMVYFVIKFML
jgi:hypothetical protein